MKMKVILSFMIFIILLLSIVFVNSYVQALSREEIIEQKILNNKITEEEYYQIYRNIGETIPNCYNNCQENENCPMYQQHSNCMKKNNQCVPKSYNCINK